MTPYNILIVEDEKEILRFVRLALENEGFRVYDASECQRGLIEAASRKPDLVILDEPTNGLDPVGIQELRDLIKRLNDSGVTVLVSSHNLAEIQHIASYVGIIINGKLKYEGKVNSNSNLEDIFMSVTREEEYSYV